MERVMLQLRKQVRPLKVKPRSRERKGSPSLAEFYIKISVSFSKNAPSLCYDDIYNGIRGKERLRREDTLVITI